MRGPDSRLTVLVLLQLLLPSQRLVRGSTLPGRWDDHTGGGGAGSTAHDRPEDGGDGKMPGWLEDHSVIPHQGRFRSLLAFIGDHDDDSDVDQEEEQVTETLAGLASASLDVNRSQKNRSEVRNPQRKDGASSPSSPQPTNFSNSESLSEAPHASLVAPSASPPLPEGERLVRLAILKRKILDGLGLDRPPNVTGPRPDIPSVVLNRLVSDQEMTVKHRYLEDPHPRQSVVFSDEGEADCGPSVAEESCFKFEMAGQVDHATVVSSSLWVYVTHAPEGASVFVARPPSHHGVRRHVVAVKKLYSREGWVEVQIPMDKYKWSANRQRHVFEVSTKPLQAGGNLTVARDSDRRPMLLLTLSQDANAARLRRSSGYGQCTANQRTCCRESFVVDIRDFGWDSWILHPMSFDAYYCKGTCDSSTRIYLNDHTAMIAMHLNSNPPQQGMVMCCASNEFHGLNILTLDNGNVFQRVIDGVVVQKCACH